MEGVIVRAEAPGDAAAVREVNERAFGRPDEAALVDRLRASGAVALSLVAVSDGHVLGHILFSPATLEPAGAPSSLVGLGPMAVLPAAQRRGVGTRLVEAGLACCRAAGHGAVVVLGHPAYYPRFGFVPAAAHGLACAYDPTGAAFMVAELRAGALAGRAGTVRYAPEFDAV